MTKFKKRLVAAFSVVALFGLMLLPTSRDSGLPIAHAQIATPAPLDPCFSNTPKTSAFANITTTTTTALITPSGTTTIYVCDVVIVSASTVTANTILLEQGTGAACAGAPTALTPTFNTGIATVAVAISLGSSSGQAFKTAAGNGLCAVSTVGTTPAIGVFVTFIQQ